MDIDTTRQTHGDFLDGKDVDPSVMCNIYEYLSSCPEDNIEARFLIGHHYLYGWCVDPDQDIALNIYTECANKGFIEAFITLGQSYEILFKYDEKYIHDAIEWLEKGVSHESGICAYELGNIYNDSYFRVKDRDKSISYYKKAAALGFELANAELGRMIDSQE